MSATHMGKGDMFHNAGTQNICKDNGTQIIQAGPDEEAKKDRQCDDYMQQNGYDPNDQKANAERKGGQLFEPVCEWIFRNPEFRQWLDGAGLSGLWLHGGPGKGKSMLLCSVINHLLELAGEVPVTPDPTPLVAYSFFSDPDGVCEAAFVVASLIYGLVKQRPSWLRCISKVYDHENKYPFKGKRSFTALGGILRDMLQDNQTGARIILVVDALDECTTDLDRLLQLILSTSLLQNVRWLVSSRGLRIIHQEFDATESKMRKLSLDQTGEDIQKAVQTYTNHRMRRLHHLRLSEEDREELQNRLMRKAGGTFLWLSIVMAELEEGSSWHIDNVVDSVEGLPEDLESLYETLLQKLLDDLGRKRTKKKLDRDVLNKTLATVAAALRPLYIEELKELAEFPVEIRDTSQVEEVVDKCGAFLTLRNNQVFLIHFSAKEFLTPNKLELAFQSDPLDIHSHLFIRSISVMKANLKRDIYNLKQPGINIRESVNKPSPDPLSPLRYSCVHWFDHLEQVEEKGPSHYQSVRCFIGKSLLYWLEAMSLQKKIDEAIEVTRKLRNLMHNVRDHELGGLTQDVLRFVQSHGFNIENHPLQVYVSALLFSSPRNWVRRLYGGEELDWISLKPNMETVWSDCMKTLPTLHHPGKLAISTDGKLLASTFQPGSRGNLVGVWDLDSYELMGEFAVDFGINILIFLSDGKRLAVTGYSQNTFEIWNAEAGSRLQTLRSPDESSVCFTSLAVPTRPDLDGDLIASGSDNGAVRLWDATTGNCTGNIHTSREPIWPLELSPDGQTLAVGLGNGTVELWDSQSRVLVRKLENHRERIISMAFFGDEKLLSTSYGKKNHRIWDWKTGSCVKTLGMGDLVHVVSLGSAGFASRSFDESTAKIWNKQGECVQVLGELQLWMANPTCCAEKQLLACATDTDISIWDLKLLANPNPTHNQPVLSLAFSSDGLLLASGSDNSIKIWDTKDCTCIRSIDCTEVGGEGLAFSPDSRHLVSRKGSWKKTGILTAWNVGDGKAARTFSNVSGREAFSPDGRLLALALGTSIVTIWDMDASKQHLEIQRGATCLTFSADGHKLALASDTNLEIWDMSNGECIWWVSHQESRVTSIELSSNTQLLAAGSIQGDVYIWDTSATALPLVVSAGAISVDAVAFSPNQELLAWADDHDVRIRNLKDGGEAGYSWSRVFTDTRKGRMSLQFDRSDSSRLCTPIGDLDTRNLFDGGVGLRGYHLERGYHLGRGDYREWIARGQERLVLLPIEYSWDTVWIVLGQRVAIGSGAGQVLLFRFA